jgi:hypothetical protein
MFFFFTFSLFFSTKLKTGGWNKSCPVGKAGDSGREKWWGKRMGGCIWCKKFVHLYVIAKMIPAETIPENREGGN